MKFDRLKVVSCSQNTDSLFHVSPTTQEIEITPEFNFLILACDGLWDTIKSKEAVKYVADRLSEGYSAKVRRARVDMMC